MLTPPTLRAIAPSPRLPSCPRPTLTRPSSHPHLALSLRPHPTLARACRIAERMPVSRKSGMHSAIRHALGGFGASRRRCPSMCSRSATKPPTCHRFRGRLRDARVRAGARSRRASPPRARAHDLSSPTRRRCAPHCEGRARPASAVESRPEARRGETSLESTVISTKSSVPSRSLVAPAVPISAGWTRNSASVATHAANAASSFATTNSLAAWWKTSRGSRSAISTPASKTITQAIPP
jgi:hypothetical protein